MVAGTSSILLKGGGTSSGQFAGSKRGSINFIAGSFTWDNGTTLIGDVAVGNFPSGASTPPVFIPENSTVEVLGSLLFVGVKLEGKGTLEVEPGAELSWFGGQMATSGGVTRIEVGAKLSMNGSRGKPLALNGRTLKIEGVASLSGGDNLVMSNGAIIDNSGQFSFTSDVGISGTGRFKNTGTVQKEQSNGTSTIEKGIAFDNQGKLLLKSGTLKIPNLTQDQKKAVQAATEEDGGRLDTDGLFRLRGGILQNDGVSAQDGEVFGDVLNTGGEVDPGGVGSTGILTIDGTNGTYTQRRSGSLHIDIAGPTPGTQYDRLIVTGTVNLGGTLKISAVPGFTGNSFDILVNESGQSIQGQFDGLPEGAEIILDGRQFFITYHGGASGNDVVLNDGMATLNKLNDSITGIVSFNDGQGHSSSEDVYLSQFNVTYTTGPTSSVTFNTFCIDLTHTVAVGQTYNVDARTDLAGTFINGGRMAYIYMHYGEADLSANPDQAAAVQLALWDLLLDNHDPQSFGLDAGTASEYSSGDPDVFKVNLGNNPDAAKIAGEVDSLLKESIGATTPGAWLDASAAGDAANRGQSLLIPEAALKQVVPALAIRWEGGYPSAPSNGPAADTVFTIVSQLSRKPADG